MIAFGCVGTLAENPGAPQLSRALARKLARESRRTEAPQLGLGVEKPPLFRI